jgi:hypothetical protein
MWNSRGEGLTAHAGEVSGDFDFKSTNGLDGVEDMEDVGQ